MRLILVAFGILSLTFPTAQSTAAEQAPAAAPAPAPTAAAAVTPAPAPAATPAPAASQPPAAAAPAPTVAAQQESRRSGWTSHYSVGPWWHLYDVTLSGSRISQVGLPSVNLGTGGEYAWSDYYIAINAEFMTPLVAWKAIGLGFFYFFCFFFSGGRCTANVPFGTGSQDAGYLSLGSHFGYKFPRTPFKAFAGLDFGLFHSGLTPFTMSALFAKLGGGIDLSDTFGLELAMRRSLIMAAWDMGNPNPAVGPSAWVFTLGLTIRN